MKRRAKKNDQIEANRCFHLLNLFFSMYPNVDGAIMASAIMTCVAKKYFESGVDYPDFCLEMDNFKKCYKYLWDENHENKPD